MLPAGSTEVLGSCTAVTASQGDGTRIGVPLVVGGSHFAESGGQASCSLVPWVPYPLDRRQAWAVRSSGQQTCCWYVEMAGGAPAILAALTCWTFRGFVLLKESYSGGVVYRDGDACQMHA